VLFTEVGRKRLPDIGTIALTFSSGELQSVDGYMNIALEKTEEYVDGQLRRNYGDAFVRGNNGKQQWTRIYTSSKITDS
jgi:hypothetical protein